MFEAIEYLGSVYLVLEYCDAGEQIAATSSNCTATTTPVCETCPARDARSVRMVPFRRTPRPSVPWAAALGSTIKPVVNWPTKLEQSEIEAILVIWARTCETRCSRDAAAMQPR